jgi:hypothetical protein
MNPYRYTIHCADQAGTRNVEVALPRPIASARDLAAVEQQLRQLMGNTALAVLAYTRYHSSPNATTTGHNGQSRRPATAGTGTTPADRTPRAHADIRRSATTGRVKPNPRSRRRLRRIGNRLFLAGVALALLAGNLLPALLHTNPNLGGGVVFHVLAPVVFLAAGALGTVCCYRWADRSTTGRRLHRSTTSERGRR